MTSTKTNVLRVSAELTRAAQAAGARFRRKTSQQIEYWANLGRALERMPGVSFKRIEDALAAQLDFDALSADERAIAMAKLDELEATRTATAMSHGPSGVLYEQDARGRVVRVHEGGTREYVATPQRRKRRSRSRA